MNEIKTFAFEGHALTFERRTDGEWYANTAEAADALGYDARSAVTRLYRRHAKEFLDGESVTVKVTVTGKPATLRLFSPRGLEHLAILGRTDTCVRFRRWLLDVSEQLRTGGAVVPADRLAALEAALAALLEDRKADRKLIEQLGALAATSIGHAGKMLSTFARSPEAKAYRDARIREGKDRKAIERANRILPLLDDTNGNGAAHG